MEYQTALKPASEVEVSPSFYKLHRQKVIDTLKKDFQAKPKSIILMKGAQTKPIGDTDNDEFCQQDDNFLYMFGIEDPDCYAVIEVDTGKTILMPPKIPEDYKIWMFVPDQNHYIKNYEVDEVIYVENIEAYLKHANPSTIYLFNGVNSDSGSRPEQPNFPALVNYNINNVDLYKVINEQRVIKDEKEIELLKHICQISAQAHFEIMRQVKEGLTEYQIEALFRYISFERCGARFMAYNCICAHGTNCATLHYIDNNKKLDKNSIMLCDMGAIYKGYCSDITICFPVSGKFTEKQKHIYEAVLDANLAVQKNVKEGVSWTDMHFLAEKIIMQHLQKHNILKQEFSIEEMQNKRVGAIFFPHGLGHLLGMRVHDVGGYTESTPQRIQGDGISKLRTSRIMKAGIVITDEPGCYFNKVLLDKAYANPEISKYLNKEVIEQYAEVGGVRIEDDLIITKEGCINMTVLPRTVQEIEDVMAGKPWVLKKN